MTTRRKAPSNGFVPAPVVATEEISSELDIETPLPDCNPITEQVLDEITSEPILEKIELPPPVIAPLLTPPVQIDFKKKEVVKEPKVIKKLRNQPRFTAHK